MAAELFALLSTTVSIAFQVKSAVEQIRYNRETHEQLVNRITSSLTQLQTESQKISRSSPGLIQAVQKLKSKLQHILGESQKPKSRLNAFSTWFLEWFYKDQVLSHLQDCERQLSFCFQEFGALGTVRVERKLGDHNIQVNRKLDELLRRTPAKTDGKHRSSVGVPIPLQARTSGSSMNSSEHSLDPPGLLSKRRRKVPVASLVRSESQTSASTVSTSHPSFRFNTYSPPITVMSGKKLSPKEEAPTYVQRHTRSTGFLPTAKSDMTTSSIHIPLGQDLGKTSSLYEIHASTLDSECKRLRSLKHLSEALIPGRNAVALRRRVYATDRNVTAVTALARSLTYLARCLKDIHVDSHFTGSKVSVELRAVLLESVELYKTAFGKDKACRVDLATALYSLSALLSEPESRTSPSAPSLNTHISFNEIQRSKKLDAALSAAEEAVHHFTVLEKEDPDAFGMDLANALLNLSFVLSDTGGHERALTISRKAVMLSYRLPLPHTQERARNIRTLHKALMRVSYCLDNLGRVEEAQEAENEANDVLRKPWFATGS
jgi:tetratricopeptide (TPR) repeat protein